MKPEGTLMQHNREEAIQLAYDLGHLYELGAHYCPQASLAALMDVFHIRDDTLFKSVFGFHGGSGNSGIGPCGALAGGITAIGYFYGRCRTEFDMMVENCTATPLVKKLVDRFGSEFEGIRCRDCQKKMFGREIDFSKEEDMRFFEENEGQDNPVHWFQGADNSCCTSRNELHAFYEKSVSQGCTENTQDNKEQNALNF